MDRLFTGYLTGATAAIIVALTCEASGLPLWYGFSIFILVTPAGIYLASRKSAQ